jgi:hypothetical protein
VLDTNIEQLVEWIGDRRFLLSSQLNVRPELLAGGCHRTTQLLANSKAIFDNTKQTIKKQFTNTRLVYELLFFEREIQKCY